MILDTEAVTMSDGKNIGNIVSTVSGKVLLVSNGTGKNLPMAVDIIRLICSVELTPNNIEAIVRVIGWVLSNGNIGISAARALGRLSDVFTGNWNIFNIVSTVSGRVLLVSNGIGDSWVMLDLRMWLIVSVSLTPNNIGNTATMASGTVL